MAFKDEFISKLDAFKIASDYVGSPPLQSIEDWLKKDIEKIPAADVVKVVRCKDCKNSDLPDMLKELIKGSTFCYQRHEIVSLDGYCHLGKRREETNHEKISD